MHLIFKISNVRILYGLLCIACLLVCSIDSLNGQSSLKLIWQNQSTIDSLESMNIKVLDEYETLPQECRAQTIVVMLTSSENPSDKQKARQYPHLSAYVTKPLTPETVIEILKVHDDVESPT